MSKNSIKIGIVANNYIAGTIGGAEVYFKSLLSGLDEVDTFNQYFIFVKEGQIKYLPKISKNMTIVGLSETLISKVKRKIINSITNVNHLSKIINSYGLDVVHFPFQAINTNNIHAPLVSTFLDIQEEYYPEYFNYKDLIARKKIHSQSADISDRVIAISHFTKKSIIDKYHLKGSKIKVIHLSFDENTFSIDVSKSKINLPKKYIFYPAASWPHKNHLILIDAFYDYLVNNPESDLSLVLSGIHKQNHHKIIEKINNYGLGNKIIMKGFVDLEDLATIYKKAIAMVFPSLFEGFGIPILEAMASDCPVICSNVASLPEIAGNAALYFNPRDKREIVSAIDRIYSQKALRKELVIKGRLQIKKFSNIKMAQDTIKIYEMAANNGKK